MAGSLSNTAVNKILLALMNATTWTNVIAVAGSPITDWYVSLHTSSPGEAGDQTTNEIAYTSYARVPVARATGTGGWTFSGTDPGYMKNTTAFDFPTMTGGAGGTVSHIGVGTVNLATGAGVLLGWSDVTTPLAVGNGVTPHVNAEAIVISLD